MTRMQVGRGLAGVSALGFFGTAGLHGTGYDSVVRVAKDVPGMMGQVMPALWLAFSLDLTVLGLIIAILAFRPSDVARPILAIAALCPLSAAGLQLRFIGFIPPTAILIAVGALTLAAAATWTTESAGRSSR